MKIVSGAGEARLDPVLKAAIAHLWFVTLHHFDEGNGRIARAFEGAGGIFGSVLREAVFFGKVRQCHRRFLHMCSHHLTEPAA